MTVNQRVKKARVYLGMSQLDLARDAGVQQSWLSSIENDKAGVNLKILEFLILNGVSGDWLICGIGEPLRAGDFNSDPGLYDVAKLQSQVNGMLEELNRIKKQIKSME